MLKDKLTGLLDYLARSLVRDPDSVEITAQEDNDSLVLTLKVAQEDMGRVIGKGGKTAKAIRSLIKAANDERDKKVVVDIAD